MPLILPRRGVLSDMVDSKGEYHPEIVVTDSHIVN